MQRETLRNVLASMAILRAKRSSQALATDLSSNSPLYLGKSSRWSRKLSPRVAGRAGKRWAPAGVLEGIGGRALPTKTLQPSSGEAWLHEIKHDGFWVIARKLDWS
jgi:hypothetical protein